MRDIASRMVVKHDSEWFGGSQHHRWKTFLQRTDRLYVAYVRQYFDDMEWMSQVPEFSSGEPVWHMHPVVFLDAIKADEYDFSTRESTIRAIVAENRKQGFFSIPRSLIFWPRSSVRQAIFSGLSEKGIGSATPQQMITDEPTTDIIRIMVVNLSKSHGIITTELIPRNWGLIWLRIQTKP